MANPDKPWFKFYAETWSGDPVLRLCSLEAKGLLTDLMALSHVGTPYGYLISGGLPLDRKDIMKLFGTEAGVAFDELVNKQRIALDETRNAYFIRRMVKDSLREEAFREAGKKGGNPKLKKKTPADPAAPKDPKKKQSIEIPEWLARSKKFVDIWEEFKKHRKAMKSRMTDLAQQKILNRMLPWGPEKAIIAMVKSIESGWKNVFEPEGVPSHSPISKEEEEKKRKQREKECREKLANDSFDAIWWHMDLIASGDEKNEDNREHELAIERLKKRIEEECGAETLKKVEAAIKFRQDRKKKKGSEK